MSLFFWCVFIFKYTCVHVSLATLLCTSFFLLSCCFFPLFPPSFACSQCWLAQFQRICHVWLVFCSGKWRDQKVTDGCCSSEWYSTGYRKWSFKWRAGQVFWSSHFEIGCLIETRILWEVKWALLKTSWRVHILEFWWSRTLQRASTSRAIQRNICQARSLCQTLWFENGKFLSFHTWCLNHWLVKRANSSNLETGNDIWHGHCLVARLGNNWQNS